MTGRRLALRASGSIWSGRSAARALAVGAAALALSACDGKGGGNADPVVGFRISGDLSSNTVPGFAADKLVTHVMAVNPSSANARRVLAEVASDGSFELYVDPGRPWVLVFLDETLVGADMIAGVFRAETLDSLAPVTEGDAEEEEVVGEADLGEMDVAGGEATMGISYDDLLEQLGIDEATASLLGEIDDLCLRYINPDIDGDGELDVDEEDHHFMMDFHVQYSMSSNGNPVDVSDIVGNFLDVSTTGMTYGGTGIYVAFPQSFYAGTIDDLEADGSLTMSEEAHYSYQTQSGPSGVVTAPAGTAVVGTGLIFNNFGNFWSFGILAVVGFDMPQGEYVFGLGDQGDLTFTQVATRTDADLQSAANFLMPFIKFNKDEPGCTSDCTLASIDYKWMKKSDSGWVDATLEEVTIIVGDQGGFISIVPTNDNGPDNVSYVVPIDAVSGTLEWSDPYHTTLSDSEVDALTTEEICHLGLSYDDKLGMRIFSGILNAPGTCSML